MLCSVDHSAAALPHAVQLGQFGGIQEELETLKRDKNVLMLELVRLRQQQQVRVVLPGNSKTRHKP